MSSTKLLKLSANCRRNAAIELAGFMLRLAVKESDPEPIDPAHMTAVLEGLEQAKRGQLATPERIDSALHLFDP